MIHTDHHHHVGHLVNQLVNLHVHHHIVHFEYIKAALLQIRKSGLSLKMTIEGQDKHKHYLTKLIIFHMGKHYNYLFLVFKDKMRSKYSLKLLAVQ